MAENSINGKNLKVVFGTEILRAGTSDWLAFPKRKASLTNNFQDQDGEQVDLSTPKFEARQFRLRCATGATGATKQECLDNFFNFRNGLFTELSKSGVYQLHLSVYNKTYNVFYVDEQNISKLSYEKNRIWVEYDLIFQETDPFSNIKKVYLVNENGVYLTAGNSIVGLP